MKIICIILSLLSLALFGQTPKDSIKSSWYARSMPVSLYTGAGTINNKVSQNIEFGKSFGVIDIGMCYGRFNLNYDTSQYLESRITMDVSQYSIYSSEMTIGLGHVFNSKTPIMLELSYTVFAQVYKKFGIGLVTGFYDFSGNTSDINKTFYGLFIRYGLLRNGNTGLLNGGGRMHHGR